MKGKEKGKREGTALELLVKRYCKNYETTVRTLQSVSIAFDILLFKKKTLKFVGCVKIC